MSKKLKRKISLLKSCQERQNPLTNETDFSTAELLSSFQRDGLVELLPDGNTNTSADVRLTDKGEEHLQKLKDQGLSKFKWIVVSTITAGIVTFIVRQYS